MKKRWTCKVRANYERMIDEYILLNGLTVSNAMKDIGIERGCYHRISNGKSLNVKNQNMVEAFFGNNLHLKFTRRSFFRASVPVTFKQSFKDEFVFPCSKFE